MGVTPIQDNKNRIRKPSPEEEEERISTPKRPDLTNLTNGTNNDND